MNSIPEVTKVAEEVPLCRQSWWIKYRDRIIFGALLLTGAIIAGIACVVAWQLRYILLGIGVLVGVLSGKDTKNAAAWAEAVVLGALACIMLPILEALFSGVIGFLTCLVGAYAIVLGSQTRSRLK